MSETRLEPLVDKDWNAVTIRGELENTHDHAVSDVVVEVRFLNSEGRVLDTETQELRAVVVPAGGSAALEVETVSNLTAAEIDSHAVEVKYAELKPRCREVPTTTAHVMLNILVSWFPMLLLIAIFVWVAKRSKTLRFLEQQTSHLDSIANETRRVGDLLEALSRERKG
ncbi:MAG: FxLYD domain-containing protein [Gammaproteobacteria bacterium]|nr:FxLYD domain-containing protein [Gammaproteobacteria bacterium]